MTINADKLQEGLRTKRLGKKIFFAKEVKSTNDWAKELANSGATEGTVTIAETQTAGRGRLDRKWISPIGGLYFSIILKPKLNPSNALKLVFVAGLAAAEALRERYGLNFETKWPNDVLANKRKVCGILLEMSTVGDKVNYVILGIGVNANFDVKSALPELLWEKTSSLQVELGRKVRLEELFKAIIEKFETVYMQFLDEGFRVILDKWKKYAGFLGCRVEVENNGERVSGIAVDVNCKGALILKREDGTLRHVYFGDLRVC